MKALDIYIDFKSPAAYLAITPSIELATKLSLSINWHPYETRQRPLPIEHANESKGETHIRVREKSIRSVHKRYAGIQGIELDFTLHPRETTLALAALTAALSNPLPFIQMAFHAYWREQLDLNCPATVSQILHKSGNDIDVSEQNTLLDAFHAAQNSAAELGVIDTPAYVLNDQLFIGREHLPWIAQLLN